MARRFSSPRRSSHSRQRLANLQAGEPPASDGAISNTSSGFWLTPESCSCFEVKGLRQSPFLHKQTLRLHELVGHESKSWRIVRDKDWFNSCLQSHLPCGEAQIHIVAMEAKGRVKSQTLVNSPSRYRNEAAISHKGRRWGFAIGCVDGLSIALVVMKHSTNETKLGIWGRPPACSLRWIWNAESLASSNAYDIPAPVHCVIQLIKNLAVVDGQVIVYEENAVKLVLVTV